MKKAGVAAVMLCAMVLGGCGSAGENLAAKEYKASEYVTLGEYTNLAVNQIEEKKELTADEQESAIQDALEQDATEQEITDRGAADGDYLAVTYTCTQNGEVVDETGDDEVQMQLGQYEYFDADGEAQLIGTKAGDVRTITVSETEDEAADGTAEEAADGGAYIYEVTVRRVYTYNVPELDDAYAKEQGYDSADAMKKSILEDALETANEEYESATKDDLIQAVVDNSETTGYPQELYDETKEQLDASYQEFFGMSLEDIYSDDEDAVKSAVEETLKQELVVEAVAEKAKLTVSQKELDEYKQSVVAQYGYEDVSALEEEYDDAALAESLLNEKVQDYLYSKAKITYVTEDEYYAAADEGDEEDTEDSSLVSEAEASDDGTEDVSGAELSEDIVDDLTEEPQE